MIKRKKGNILDDPSEALVNTVNCVGVMGRGLALQFKNAFPKNYAEYREACMREEVVLGRMFITRESSGARLRYIVNFPTKHHWRDKSRLSDIERGLRDLRREIKVKNIKSIAVPGLGCNLGGLKWSDVRKIIYDALRDSCPEVSLYEPDFMHSALERKTKMMNSRMTRRLAAMLILKSKYEEGGIDPHADANDLHRLMYLLQESGEKLNLEFQLSKIGVQSKKLKSAISKVASEDDMERLNAESPIARDCQDVMLDAAQKFLMKHESTHSRIKRVSRLIEGYETPICLELLTTVHWFIRNIDVGSEDDAADMVRERNERLSKFPKDVILQVRSHLASHGFIQQREVVLQ